MSRDRTRKIEITNGTLVENVYLHLCVCGRCDHWFPNPSHGACMGACAKHHWHVGRNRIACKDMSASNEAMLSMILDTAVIDGELRGIGYGKNRKYARYEREADNG